MEDLIREIVGGAALTDLILTTLASIALAVATAEAERCGEAMPLLDEYLARYPDRGKARQISRLRDSCEQRVRVQAP